jgi:hypothetical protein
VRSYRPIRLGAIEDGQLRKELQTVDDFLRQVSSNMARVVTLPQGTPTIVTNPSTSFDSNVYLYLPGRSSEQQSFGPVSFETIGVPYTGAATPTTESTLLFRAATSDGSAQPARVFWGIQGSRAAATPAPRNRYWVIPSFTEVNTGPSSGLHYFVDQADFQTLSKKTFTNDCYYQIEDTTGGSGFLTAAHDKTLQWAWGGGYPAGGGTTTAPTTLTGVLPSVQIPALDYKDNGAGVRDRTHAWAIVKRAHTFSSGTGAPYEPSGLLFGSSSGRELYPMFTTAQGTLVAPTDNSFPIWHPTVNQSCTFTTSSAVVTMASTTGIDVGMRMRETTNSYALSEDTHVKSVDSPTQITMSQVWPASNLVRSVDFFGMTWSDTASSISLGAGALTDYLYLPGRTGGQVIGSGSITGVPNTDDVRMSGRLIINPSSAAPVIDTYLTVQAPATAITGSKNLTLFSSSVTAGGSSTATYIALKTAVTGGASITGGNPSFLGGSLSVSPSIGANVSVVDVVGLDMSALCNVTGSLTSVGNIAGLRGAARAGGGSALFDTFVYNEVTGIRGIVSAGGTAKVTEMNGIKITMDQTTKSFGYTLRTIGVNADLFGDTSGTSWGSQSVTCTVTATSPNLVNVNRLVQTGLYVTGTGVPAGTYIVTGAPSGGIAVMSNNATANGTSVTIWGTTLYWSGFYRTLALPIGGEVINARFFDLQADIPSQHYGYFYLRPATPGAYTAPTGYLHLGAGTTAATTAPIKFDVGTNMTTAEAGAIEYNGTAWYMTHADAVRTLAVTQRGSVDLTAQTAAIGATALYAPPAAGYYVVHYTIEDTTADVTAGTIQFQVNYTDDIGATNQTGAALALTATGRDRGAFEVYSASGTITYQTNLTGIMGTAQYALRVRITFLG